MDLRREVNGIKISINNKDFIIYVRILSILEKIFKIKLGVNDKKRLTFKNLIDKICEIICLSSMEKNMLIEINRLGNDVKHSSVNIPDFNIYKVKEMIKICKSLYDKCFSDDEENCFDNVLSEINDSFKKIKKQKNEETLEIKENDDQIDSIIAAVSLNSSTMNYEPNKYWYFSNFGFFDSGFYIEKLLLKAQISEIDDWVYGVIFEILTKNKESRSNLFIDSKYGEYDIKKIRTYELLLLVLFKNGHLDKKSNFNINTNLQDFKYLQIALEDIYNYHRMVYSLITKAKKIYHYFTLDSKKKDFFDLYTINCPEEISIDDSSYNFEWEIQTKVHYNIDVIEHRFILEYLLKDIFKHEKFKDGQMESIVYMLNCNANSLCVLPTGYGKSLIFQFVSFMLVGTSLIVTPTNILIEDQLKNLDEFYGIDNCLGILNNKEKERNLGLINKHKLVYISSDTLLEAEVHKKLLKYNMNKWFAQIVIDEIHTISNWSHEFSPSYLMLSYNLKMDYKNIRFRGFTATATQKVIKSICYQMDINEQNIITIESKINNTFDYNYIKTNNLIESLSELVREENRNGKTVIFSNEYNKELNEIINKDKRFLVVQNEGTDNYSTFIYDDKKILCATHELGVGLNLPEIKSVIHYNIPFSIPQYVQEIGRANRDNSGAFSYVLFSEYNNQIDINFLNRVYKKTDLGNMIPKCEDKSLLIGLLKSILIKDMDNKSTAENYTIKLMNEIVRLKDYKMVRFKIGSKIKIVYLYVLTVLGLIKQWFFEKTDEDGVQYVLVYLNKFSLHECKKKMEEFFTKTDFNNEYLSSIRDCHSFDECVSVYYNWWYREYLYFHSEQLIDSYNLFNRLKSKEEIELELNVYLDLSYLRNINVFKDKTSIEEILDNIEEIYSQVNARKQSILDKYNIEDDIALFLASINSRYIEFSRLDRALQNSNNDELKMFNNNIVKIYNYFNNNDDKQQYLEVLLKHFDFQIILDKLIKHKINDDIVSALYIRYFVERVENLGDRK